MRCSDVNAVISLPCLSTTLTAARSMSGPPEESRWHLILAKQREKEAVGSQPVLQEKPL